MDELKDLITGRARYVSKDGVVCDAITGREILSAPKGGAEVAVDAALDAESENPVQNKAIKAALDLKAPTSHTHTIANVTGLQTALDGKANASTTYSKTEVDGKLAEKVDEETYGTAIGILNRQVATLNQQMSERVLASQVYTKGEVDTKLGMKVDTSTYGLKMNEITLALDEKAKASEVYSKTEIDNKFGTFETQANAVIGGN